MIENLRTPVGRIVWGNPAKATTKKDQKTRQPILKDGKEVEQWAFGVAFPKHEFNAYMKPYFDQEAMSAYPHGVPQGFSWKYKDGDGIDRQGKPLAEKTGYAGNIVLTVSTEAFAPPIFRYENGAYRQVGPDEIKTGDYVVLSLNIKVNVPTDRTHTPGLYVNPNGIELVGVGEVIMQSADPSEMFGGVQHHLPPGAQPLPAGAYVPGGGMQPGMPAGYPAQQPQQPQPGYPVQQPQQPQPGYPVQQPQPGYPGYPAPATDFVQPGMMPPR